MPTPFEQYLTGDYLAHNPTWDIEDSPWKAHQVLRMLRIHHLDPHDIVEVGCGGGGVLAALRTSFPDASLVGYEIAPDAAKFWAAHGTAGIRFVLGDFLATNGHRFDVLLLLDVLEHLPNPFEFLQRLHGQAEHYVFHIPLDLSASSVLRGQPLLHVRRNVGHIHYFTKELALTLLEECGFDVVDWFYTGASLNSPNRSLKTRLSALPRRLAYAFNKNFGVRLLGGETLLVLAKPSS